MKKWIIILALLAVGAVSIVAVMTTQDKSCAVAQNETARVVRLESSSAVMAGYKTTAGQLMAAMVQK